MSLYDIEKFDPQPDPDLICCICQCVLHKAVESPCRHVFCQACIGRWLSKRHTCPTCRKRTWKMDLKPVLPLVQNMLNRLLMRCDFFNNGCVQKIMLEHFENHIKDCGYEMKTCRFIKCGSKILKMNLEVHENELCEHRESFCEGECGLMIALSDRPGHNCVTALKAHIDEKNRIIETLKAKLHELNNLSLTLNEQLEQLRQQLDENNPMNFRALLSSSDSVVSDMSDDLREVSMDLTSSISNDTLGNENIDSTDDNMVYDIRNEAIDVVQQVERTVVSSLIDLSSRLERVRNQMRSVLDRGIMDEDNNLDDDVHIPSDALNAIVNSSINASTTPRSSNNNASFSPGGTISVNTSSSSNDTLGVSMEEREPTDSELPAVTEYSPTSFHSNSDLSADDWDANEVTSTNPNGSTNYNSSPLMNQTWIRDTTTNPSVQRSTQNWVQNVAQPSVHRTTQNWVEGTVQSPIHIIESQPPRSPSQSSESSYSSIPTVSSIQSITSGRNNNLDQHHSSPTGTNGYYKYSDQGSQSSGDLSFSLCSTINKTPTGDSASENDSESESIHEPNRPVIVASSCDTSAVGSSIDEHFDTTSNHSHSKSKYYTDGSGDDTDDSDDLNQESDNKSCHTDLSENEASCNGESLIVNHFTDFKSNTLGDESDDASKSSERLNYNDTQSADSSDDDDSKQKRHCFARNLETTGTSRAVQNISKLKDDINPTHADDIQDRKESTCQTLKQDDLLPPKMDESRSSTTCEYFSAHSTLLSDGSDPSDHENNRRTWKYETSQSAHRIDPARTKTGKASLITIISESEHDEDMSDSHAVSKPDRSTYDQQPNSQSVSLVVSPDPVDTKRVKKSLEQNTTAVDLSSKTQDRKVVKQKGRFKKSVVTSSQQGVDFKDIKPENSGTRICNTAESLNETYTKVPENRKRRHDKLHDVAETSKQTRLGNMMSSGYSSAYINQQFKQSSPRTESGQSSRKLRPSIGSQSAASTHDKNTQSLNVKIDLSLINYSGNILTQPVSQSAPTSGSALIHSSTSISPQQYTATAPVRQPRSLRSSDPSTLSGYARQSNNNQRRVKETVNSIKSASVDIETHHPDLSSNHREFPNLWRDDSDSDSDRTWVPDPGVHHDTDVTVSEEGETESETEYEVKIPKSAADLLEEYASDDTDESWTYGQESVD